MRPKRLFDAHTKMCARFRQLLCYPIGPGLPCPFYSGSMLRYFFYNVVMPQERTLARIDKLTKLVAVFDQFHEAIARVDDPTAKRLVENWAGIRHQYLEPAGAPRSALASGMEQGLRETPMLLQSMHPEARKCAVQALAAATLAHYPDFINKDAVRLAKIKARGSIRGENEFYLVRHHVDLLEGEPSQEQELRLLYELMDRFEGRRT